MMQKITSYKDLNEIIKDIFYTLKINDMGELLLLQLYNYDLILNTIKILREKYFIDWVAIPEEYDIFEKCTGTFLERVKDELEENIGIYLFFIKSVGFRDKILNISKKNSNKSFLLFLDCNICNNELVKLYRENNNIIPIININDINIENKKVYNKEGLILHLLGKNNVIYGISLFINSNNINTSTNIELIQYYLKEGCKTILYFEDRYALSLSVEERKILEEKLKTIRSIYPDALIIFIEEKLNFFNL